MSDLTLGQKQRLFAKLLGEFLTWINAQPGYEVTMGEALRSDEQAQIHALGAIGRAKLITATLAKFPAFAKALEDNMGDGSAHSIHQDKLAVDLNLFINGAYQTSTEAYRPLGDKWVSMHPLCRWGGEFKDGNHFSITHGGLK